MISIRERQAEVKRLRGQIPDITFHLLVPLDEVLVIKDSLKFPLELGSFVLEGTTSASRPSQSHPLVFFHLPEPEGCEGRQIENLASRNEDDDSNMSLLETGLISAVGFVFIGPLGLAAGPVVGVIKGSSESDLPCVLGGVGQSSNISSGEDWG